MTSSATTRQPLCNYFSPDESQLMSELGWCFRFFPRPRDADIHPSRSSNVPFLLLPHGAFCDSGPLVADALVELDMGTSFFRPKDGIPNYRTVVLVGTEHACTAQHFVSLGGFTEWSTPLGKIPIDAELFRRLTMLPVESQPFVCEHSIENMLPFLQFMTKDQNIELRILPLSVRGTVTSDEFDGIIQGRTSSMLKDLASVLSEYDETHAPIAVLATTDYSHVGPSYGFVPPGWPSPGSESIPDFIRRVDEPTLRAVITDNVDTLYKVGRQTSMCGLGAALVWMKLESFMNRVEGQHTRKRPVSMLKHCVGSDIGPPHNDQTGFATFIIS